MQIYPLAGAIIYQIHFYSRNDKTIGSRHFPPPFSE
jgi:hypothetical protein